ncbi:MAG: hypothetical protein WCD70_10880 [Alphaproteobacteria bacterium]
MKRNSGSLTKRLIIAQVSVLALTLACSAPSMAEQNNNVEAGTIVTVHNHLYGLNGNGQWVAVNSNGGGQNVIHSPKLIEMLNKAEQALQANAASATAAAATTTAATMAAAAVVAVPNPNCTITIPANPLSARGLATPYTLAATDPAQGPCDETNGAQSAFVQAAIFDPATQTISVYNPLIINEGTNPAASPVLPTLPKGAVVALWFGFNGSTLTQADTNNGATLAGNNCVNGGVTPFTQFSYCNAPTFFAAVHPAIASGALKVPALGTATDGMACPTVRSFDIVDQDQSDNLPMGYLVTSNGELAQNTVANAAKFAGATLTLNASDNGLVDHFLDPALGCTPWTVSDLANPGQTAPALALNELLAANRQAGPIALVPAGDPMTMENDQYNLEKLNAYRVGVDQPALSNIDNADTPRYCRQMIRNTPARLMLDETLFTGPSPVAGASSLFNFLVMRFSQSLGFLDCEGLTGLMDPTVLQTDANGNVIGASFNQTVLQNDLNAIAPFEKSDLKADSPKSE